MSVFEDQAVFMLACGQTVGKKNREQFELYMELIREEFQELQDADTHEQVFDALLDLIVVCIGAGHSAGYPMEAGWDAVVASNLRKIDPATGQVLEALDVLKAENARLRAALEELQTAGATPPEVLLVHAMHALEELQAEVERLRTDGASAVRWAPGSAYWSEVLVELFGVDARKGIDVLERRWQAALERAERNEVLLRQALEALELRCGPHADERKELIPTLRERLGLKQ